MALDGSWFIGEWWHERTMIHAGEGKSIVKKYLNISSSSGSLHVICASNLRQEWNIRGGGLCVSDVLGEHEAIAVEVTENSLSLQYPNGNFIKRLDNCNSYGDSKVSNGFPDQYLKVDDKTLRSSRWSADVYLRRVPPATLKASKLIDVDDTGDQAALTELRKSLFVLS